VSIKTSNSFSRMQENMKSPSSIQNNKSKSGFGSGTDSANNSYVKHLTSTGSMQSQSSAGSSTLSTIQGLNEINKIILTKNGNPRKELLNNRDNKVYSYKLNQLISIIKYNVNRKTTKKKSTVTKAPSSGHIKKTCRKVKKDIKKIPKKSTSKSSIVSKQSYTGNNDKDFLSYMRCNTSTTKKAMMSSSRKKPPLIKAGGVSNASKLLRYPSNASNQRNTSISAKSNNSEHKVILPAKLSKRLNSNKTLDANQDNHSMNRTGYVIKPTHHRIYSIDMPIMSSCVNASVLNDTTRHGSVKSSNVSPF
jgi:hypothetical protein